VHLWDDKIGTVGPTYTSARSADNSSMTPSLAVGATELHPAPVAAGAPRLRLLPKGGGTPRADERDHGAWADHRDGSGERVAATRGDLPVLIAGRDAARRAEVRCELRELMPAGTRFEELGTFWEVLVQAPSARMVILSGELDELPAESLLHTLGHRHPDLPVVSLDAEQIA